MRWLTLRSLTISVRPVTCPGRRLCALEAVLHSAECTAAAEYWRRLMAKGQQGGAAAAGWQLRRCQSFIDGVQAGHAVLLTGCSWLD